MTTTRKSEDTRLKILNATFKEIHKHGYQGMRIDQVLINTGLKKGALYHYFSSKQELAYAVLEELIQKNMYKLWIEPLNDVADPLEAIHSIFEERENWSDEFFSLGCPLNNLAQEMSPIDEGFRARIEKIFLEWRSAISEALKKGQIQGAVDKAINTEECGLFILASIEGTLSMAKNHQNKEVFYSCCKELKRYLNTLKEK
jgi:AcrR family transcriptional regulator